MAGAAISVDELADACDGEAEDRAQARARAASVARTWESLLDDEGSLRDGREAAATRDKGPGVGAGASVRPRGTAANIPAAACASAAAAAGDTTVPRRAMVRYTQLLVDMTDASRQPDYKPRRLEFAVDAAGRFARKFLAENPLAELGLAVLRGGTCEAAAALGSSSEEFEERLLRAAAEGPRGRMSIASGLLRAIGVLEDAPPYGTREVLLLFGSLSNWDPVEASAEGTIAELQEKRIRISVVSMSPEMRILQRVCAQTGGSYGVALDAHHFEELLLSHVPAPPCGPRTLEPRLIRMGFPRQVFEVAVPVACACHLKLHSRLFMCPQCHARVCKVPSRCPTCDLPLVSAPLIARSFRHLRPLPPFAPVGGAAANGDRRAAQPGGPRCCGCQLPGPLRSQCPSCRGLFCEACDEFAHGALQQCPGCLETSEVAA